MSAFVVEDDLIIMLAAYAVQGRRYGEYNVYPGSVPSLPAGGMSQVEIAQAYADILLRENYRSVNYRYKENGECHKVRITPMLIENFDSFGVTVGQIAKACDCLEYQSCETDDYYSTEAFYILGAIRKSLLSGLDSYDSAEWGFTFKQNEYQLSLVE